MLIGRDLLLDRLQLRASQVASGGAGGCVAVVGGAGVGKTALLGAAVASAGAGMRVIRLTGVESEADLPHAALHSLVEATGAAIERIDPRARQALQAALGASTPQGPPPDRFLVGLSVLALLAAAAEPLVVVVDDLQWVDAGSREALLLAARRLGPEPVLLLFGVRTGTPAPPDLSGVEVLDVGMLDPASSAELVRQSTRFTVAPAVAAAIAAATGGHPLALREVAARLSAAEAAGSAMLPEPLPTGARAAGLFEPELRSATEAERRALLLVALHPEGDRATIAGALGADAATIDGLIDRDLLREEDGLLRFRHPLIGASAQQLAGAAARRQAHADLAAVLAPPGASVSPRAVWHRALAADGADAELADALEQVALAAQRSAAAATAASAFARAARLSPDPAQRARRLLAAAGCSAHAGADPDAFIEECVAYAGQDETAADALILRACVAAWRGDNATTTDTVATNEAWIRALDPVRGAILRGPLFSVRWFAFAFAEAARDASDGAPAASPADLGGTGILAQYLYATGLLVLGRLEEARATLLPCVPVARSLPDLTAASPLLFLLPCADEAEAARALVRELTGFTRATGALAQLMWAQTACAQLELHTFGDLHAARAANEEVLELGADISPYAFGQAQAMATVLAAHHGAPVPVDALAAAEPSMPPPVRNSSLHARMLVAWLAGDQRTAGDLASEIEALLASGGIFSATWMPARFDAAEVLAACGDARAGAWQDAVPLPRWCRERVARTRMVLAEPARLDDAYAAALQAGAGHENRFDRARTRLAYGQRLLAAGRQRDAVVELSAAGEQLCSLGAMAWSRSAQVALAAVGGGAASASSGDEEPALADPLTPAERRVAAIAATGVPTRAIASTLFLSPKTVEMHLGRIYRKLDVRGKAELAARVSAPGGERLLG